MKQTIKKVVIVFAVIFSLAIYIPSYVQYAQAHPAEEKIKELKELAKYYGFDNNENCFSETEIGEPVFHDSLYSVNIQKIIRGE